MGAAKRRKEAGDQTYNLPKRQRGRGRRTVERHVMPEEPALLVDEHSVMPMFIALLMASRRRSGLLQKRKDDVT